MPEQLKQEELHKDITVAKQYDSETPSEKKFEDMYAIADKLKIGMMGSFRDGIGPVARAMAVAKRTGPDFLFLANANSQKFQDLEKNKVATLYFFNSSNADWISVTGECTSTGNEDPRIKEVYSKFVSAWFGDLGDGKHTGGPEDPRMKLIEIKAKHISYWQHETTGTLGFMKEVGGAVMTGNVANNGTLRQMFEDEIKQARSSQSSMTS